MQSGQDCLIYHMLGNSLRRLHVSRTKIGSLLTGWFAERLWAELAFKSFNSPEHPPNTSFLQCALLFPSSIRVTTRIFNRWEVKARRVQSTDYHDIDNRNRRSRKISCKNTMWEDFAVCQGWVGEKLFRALRDAQLHCMPKFVIFFWFCKKRKTTSYMSKRSVKRTQGEEKSWAESNEGLKVPWSQSGLSTFERSFIPPTQKGPEDLLSWRCLICGRGTMMALHAQTCLCFVIMVPARGQNGLSHTWSSQTSNWEAAGCGTI